MEIESGDPTLMFWQAAAITGPVGVIVLALVLATRLLRARFNTALRAHVVEADEVVGQMEEGEVDIVPMLVAKRYPVPICPSALRIGSGSSRPSGSSRSRNSRPA